MNKRPNFSEDYIEAQASIKVKFHLNALTMEEWGTMHLNVLIRKWRISQEGKRKPISAASQKGTDLIEDLFMFNKTVVHLRAQMTPPMKREHQNSF